MYRFSLTKLGDQDFIEHDGEGKGPSNAHILAINQIRNQRALIGIIPVKWRLSMAGV